MESHFAIKRTFEINRTIAIKVVNIYYEIKKEANHKEDIKQFKKNFVKFIVQYMDNTYFTEEIAKRLFLSIITLEDEHEKDYTDKEWKCENYYKFSYKEVGHLFLSVKNYHYLNDIKNNNFETTDEMMNIMIECDWEIEENECCICKWHGYDMEWPNIEERGKFYYCTPGNINRPVCKSCVKSKYVDINISLADEPEYGTVDYLEKNNLIKCTNCGNIWDGCAQCNCWNFQDYLETPLDLYQVDNVEKNEPKNEPKNEHTSSEPTPEEVFIQRFPRPTKPLPLPPSLLAPSLLAPSLLAPTLLDKRDKQIKDLEKEKKDLVEQNKKLSHELSNLKQKIEELFNLTKKE
jgi:hypothetical protein